MSRVLLLLVGLVAVFAEPPCQDYAPGVFGITFATSKGNFSIQVDPDCALNSADRFWSALHCGHYTPDEFFWVVPNKYVQFGLSGNTTDDALWVNETFPSDIPTQKNTAGWVSFYTPGMNTGSVQLVINLATNTDFDAQGYAPFGQISANDMKVVQSLYSGYGTQPDVNQILAVGNSYLKQNFPKLDYNVAVTPTVNCAKGTKTCQYVDGDPFAIQCCPSGENCIYGVGCRCLTGTCAP